MATLQRSMSIISYLLKPILVEKYDDMIEQCGLKNVKLDFNNLKTFKDLKFNKLGDKRVLFVRIK
ncbi:Uncharacterised protein [Mycoplasma putrefaciens]|nr:Uncharacterised protein [Mycoplasma putrefaciens]